MITIQINFEHKQNKGKQLNLISSQLENNRLWSTCIRCEVHGTNALGTTGAPAHSTAAHRNWARERKETKNSHRVWIEEMREKDLSTHTRALGRRSAARTLNHFVESSTGDFVQTTLQPPWHPDHRKTVGYRKVGVVCAHRPSYKKGDVKNQPTHNNFNNTAIFAD